MKSQIPAALLVLSLLFASAGCGPQEPAEPPAPEEPTVAEVTESIEEVNQAFEAAAAAGDAATIASFYTPDAVLYSPGSPPVRGRDGIREAFVGMVGDGLAVDLLTVDLEVLGDMAHEYGTVTFFSAEGDTLATDQFTVLWKLHDGAWKLHHDAIIGPIQ